VDGTTRRAGRTLTCLLLSIELSNPRIVNVASGKMTMSKKDLKEIKRAAVAKRFKEVSDQIEILSGMWDEATLDFLILILGIGKVHLDE
jgi:hypothetical protein